MDADTVYLWRVYCTDSDETQYVWSPTKPTVCPLNASHGLDATLTTQVQEIRKNIVTIEEELIKTQGIYQYVGKNTVIPAGTPGDITTIDFVWPYRVTLLTGGFDTTSAQLGDELEFVVAPDTVIGVLIAPTDGTTTLHVNSTVTDNIYIGFPVALSDGVNMERLGVCTQKGPGTITVEIAPTFVFQAMTPVRISVEVIKNVKVVAERRYTFAEKKLGGKAIGPNTVMRVYYKNNNGQEKELNSAMEILY